MTEPAYPNETVLFVNDKTGQRVLVTTGDTGTIEISLEALATMLKALGYKMEMIDD